MRDHVIIADRVNSHIESEATNHRFLHMIPWENQWYSLCFKGNDYTHMSMKTMQQENHITFNGELPVISGWAYCSLFDWLSVEGH